MCEGGWCKHPGHQSCAQPAPTSTWSQLFAAPPHGDLRWVSILEVTQLQGPASGEQELATYTASLL